MQSGEQIVKLSQLLLNFLYASYYDYCSNINVTAPDKYPIKAKKEIFFIYQMKFILKIPITATPAADPITNKLPPVPAQYAKNSQKTPSTAKSPVALISYIPIAPATKGTLSKIADKNPMNILMIK